MPYKDPEKQKAYLREYTQKPKNKERRKKVNQRYYRKRVYGSESAYWDYRIKKNKADTDLVFKYLKKEMNIRRKRRSLLRSFLQKRCPTSTRARRWRTNQSYYRKSVYGSEWKWYLAHQERKARQAQQHLEKILPSIMKQLGLS